MKSLQIAKDLRLPREIVTQTIAILAKRRAGKSYAMRKTVEELFESGEQVILVDPKGDQWGIRSSADGKKPGLPVVILGGEHGDVPLQVGSGEIVAKLAVEERVSIVLDLSVFRKHEVATFMTAFLENLYRLKAKEEYRTPCMVVIDEADAIAPQKPQKGEERMLGAADDIVRRGGQRGIGCCLVTQRSAVLNKNVLTQAQMLVVLRTIAPQDLAAIKSWIEVHGDLEQGREMMESLPSLPIGDAWFWSPGWPTEEGIFQRSHVLPIKTFDSGATPKPGEKKVTPKNLADVNLDALKKQMAATIEEAEKNDPKALRKQIGELKSVIKEQESIISKGVSPVTDPEVIEKAVKEAIAQRDKEWNKSIQAWQVYADSFLSRFNDYANAISELRKKAPGASELPAELRPWFVASKNYPPMIKGHRGVDFKIKNAPFGSSVGAAVAATAERQLAAAQDEGGELSGVPLKLLKAVVSFYPKPATRSQAAITAAIKKGNSTFRNSVSKLRTRGYIEVEGENLTATPLGVAYLGDNAPTAPETPEEKVARFRELFSGVPLTMFNFLIGLEAEWSTREEIAAALDLDMTVSTFRNAISKLNGMGVIEVQGNSIRASEDLFN